VFQHAADFNAIKDVEGDFWADSMAAVMGGDSRSYKDMQAFLLYQRAKEEVAMLKVCLLFFFLMVNGLWIYIEPKIN
jgi:hypothetical protein